MGEANACHLVWDWNGTLLDDLALVVASTNAALTSVGGRPVTVPEHRLDFHRPVASYYGKVLGRVVEPDEFARLDQAFHRTYRAGLPGCSLAPDAVAAIRAWPGSQSLLSMFFHTELLAAVRRMGLRRHLARVDGLRQRVGGGSKLPHLRAHLDALGAEPSKCVLIGDSVDDAEAGHAVGAQVVLYGGGVSHESLLERTGAPVAATLLEAVGLATRLVSGAPARRVDSVRA